MSKISDYAMTSLGLDFSICNHIIENKKIFFDKNNVDHCLLEPETAIFVTLDRQKPLFLNLDAFQKHCWVKLLKKSPGPVQNKNNCDIIYLVSVQSLSLQRQIDLLELAFKQLIFPRKSKSVRVHFTKIDVELNSNI